MMTVNSRAFLRILASLFIGMVTVLPSAGQDACAQKISVDLQRLLQRQLPKWTVVKAGDLTPRNRAQWEKAHPNRCPGIAEGYFESSKAPSLALLLTYREDGKLWEQLVLAKKRSNGRYRLRVIESKSETPNVPVITKAPPGKYYSADGYLDVTIKRDGVLIEEIGVGSILYYLADGKVKSLITSE